MKCRQYAKCGLCKLKTRVQTRRQLEQWREFGCVHAESEQSADEHEQQHWLSRRQEPLAPAGAFEYFQGAGLQEWLLITVVASVHLEDLPFTLVRAPFFGVKYDRWGPISVLAAFGSRRKSLAVGRVTHG